MPPGQPIGECGAATQDSIVISWNEVSDGGSPITSYSITYEPVGNNDINRRINVPLTAQNNEAFFINRSFEADGLQGETAY